MNPGSDFCCVFVTVPNMVAARKIASAALKLKLAACANLMPRIESHYWWEGKLESSSEVLMIFKTMRTSLEPLEACVVGNHPYETPEFLVLGVDQGNLKYLDWIKGSLKTE